MSVTIQTHVIDEDCATCARCGAKIPNIRTGELMVPHRAGEIVGLVTGNHFKPVPYRPNPAREKEDPCA